MKTLKDNPSTAAASILYIAAFVAVIVLASIAAVSAQTLPDAPSPDFFSKINVTLMALDGAAVAADGYWTSQNRRELDPVLAPFVNHGTSARMAWFAGELGADIGIAYLLHRTHHYRLERIALMAGIGGSTYGAVYSATHTGGRPHYAQPPSSGCNPFQPSACK